MCIAVSVANESPERHEKLEGIQTPGLRFSANPSQAEISRARVFEEPLVPIGAEPSQAENADLAAALLTYAQRNGPDDFTSLTGFLIRHPNSPWRVALLTDLGLEYYKNAYYSRALNAWKEAWELGQQATHTHGKFVADRAACELAGLYSRLGRMDELEALLKSVEGRAFIGGVSERMNIAREALWMMQNQPGISFRCGPLALHSILRSDEKLLASAPTNALMEFFNSASTHQGFSLPQVAALSKKMGLDYQMAFREKGGAFVIPSVVHWKVGHYAALVRQVGDRYLAEDPTFMNSAWPTRTALEEESTGYFLIPPGPLPEGWRAVTAEEGCLIWGKGNVASIDPDIYTPTDLQAGSCSSGDSEVGMAISRVHLALVNLQIRDTPVGYTPPVGPPVYFTVRYNHRDHLQLASDTDKMLGAVWTHDWNESIRDDTLNPLTDVRYEVGGGGARTFTGFNTNTQTFAYQRYDQTLLKRISSDRYEMVWHDGSKRVFGLRYSPTKVVLTEVVDPAGNAVTLTYGAQGLVAITDAIGQVTTISYDHPTNQFLITRVTDPFGRMATFEYYERVADWTVSGPCTNIVATSNTVWQLRKITDVLGLTSQFAHQDARTNVYIQFNPVAGDYCTNKHIYYTSFLTSLSTPYGTTDFLGGQLASAPSRYLETFYPDGSRDRVEFNQTEAIVGFPSFDPAWTVPQGMGLANTFLAARNTFYWDRNACAKAYGDYTKARIFHWLHAENGSSASGILESTKAPLEGRVWYRYAGQSGSVSVGNTDKPGQIGRVLDDGATQLFTYGYNGFGNLTNSIDPLGRTFRFNYASNGIDLIEVRQTRAGNNALLFAATYNSQHLPLTLTDAAGRTTTNTYNARGQLLTTTNPKNETTSLTYNTNGYLLVVDGPLPGTNDSLHLEYDSFGRMQSHTDSSGYALAYSYDAMDRLTNVTFPDASYSAYSYNRLDLAQIRDRAGQITSMEHDGLRRLSKVTDPLNRTTRLQWCRCGALESVIDPMGRFTEWQRDLQGRLTAKIYADGSAVSYTYENRSSRIQQVVDEQLQVKTFTHNLDNTLRAVSYLNTAVPTPAVTYNYDPDYLRVRSMDDELGTTLFNYLPPGSPGAGKLASVDGPWADDTVSYQYDALRRITNRSINGVAESWNYDALGRIVSHENSLGFFGRAYDGASTRVTNVTYPSGQFTQFEYLPAVGDQRLQRITHRRADTSQLSRFTYAYDVMGNITNWVQELGSGARTWSASYDQVHRLTNLAANMGGTNLSTIQYGYDDADNLLMESVDGSPVLAYFNALNQRVAADVGVSNRVYEWNARHRLTAIVEGPNRSEFAYDGRGRLRIITEKSGENIIGQKRFLWCGLELCEERDTNNAVVGRFFPLGEQRGGTNLYYFADHLGSVREVTDESSTLLGEFMYSPFGVVEQLAGDMNSTFGFTRLLNHEVSQNLFAIHRVYDPSTARWLSRDPIGERAGMNLYGYVGQNPLRWVDPSGLEHIPYLDYFRNYWRGGAPKDLSSTAGPIYQAVTSATDLAYEYHLLARGKSLYGAFGTATDIIQSVVDIGRLLENPNADTVKGAFTSCFETTLAIAAPQVGVPFKVLHYLADQGVFDAINSARIFMSPEDYAQFQEETQAAAEEFFKQFEKKSFIDKLLEEAE